MKKIFFIAAISFLLACQKDSEPIKPKPSIPTKDEGKKPEEEQKAPPVLKSSISRFNPPQPRFSSGPVTLEDYLSAPIMPGAVYKLWEKGYANYAPDQPLGEIRRKSFEENYRGFGAGRKKMGNWIKATLGQDESEVVAKLKDLNPPTAWTIQEIDDVFDKLKKESPPEPNAPIPNFVVVKGVNVNFLADMPVGNGAIVQLASQFDYLESPNKEVQLVSSYTGDPSQGPHGVIEALAATLYRYTMVTTQKLQDALKNVVPANAYDKYYKNGYLEPALAYDQGQIKNLSDAISANIKKLRILAQWVMTEGSGATDLQVFSAAPSFQMQGGYKNKEEAMICDQLVPPQYEAIGKLAVIRAIKTGQTVPVHLTAVGQGFFGNPISSYIESLKRIARVVKGYPKVKIYVHAWDSLEKIEQAFKANEGTYTLSNPISKEEYAKLQAP